MWAVYALLSSLFSCAYYFGNQISKVAPNIFMFYRGAVPAILLLPLLPIVDFIPNWQFYIICILQGAIVSFIDYRNFRAMRTWGAETISSIHPFNIGFVFVCWVIIKPSDIVFYLEHPFRLVGVLSALIGVIYAVSSFRQSKRSARALRYMIPYILASALCEALNKFCMSFVPQSHLASGSYFYIMITAIVVAFVNLMIFRHRGENFKLLYQKCNLKYAPVMLLLMIMMALKNYAMFNTPNPSFVTAIMYTYVIWIMLFALVLRRLHINTPHRVLPAGKVILLLVSIVLLIFVEK